MKRAKKPRTKVLAIIALVSILAAMIFTSIVEPYINQYKLALQEMIQLQLKLVKIQGDMLVKARIDDMYSQIEPLISNQGTNQKEISLFTRQLGQLYTKMPVKIQSVKILPLVSDVFYSKLYISVDMSGMAKDIIWFISSLESCTEPLRIEKFSLKAKDRTDYIQASFLISKVIAKNEDVDIKKGI